MSAHAWPPSCNSARTLGNSVAVARGLNLFNDTTVETDVFVLQKNPQILRALRLLLPPAPGAAQRESGRLMIIGSMYRDGRISLAERQIVEGESYQPAPFFKPLDVTPLPKNWVPEPGTW